MVRIAEEPEGDPTERLNLDDYNSDDFNEYLSDNTEATPPTITEAQVTTKEDLPYQQSTPLDPSLGKQDLEIQDLCREILMVRIAKEPEGDPTERLNLDDYNSDDFNEYLSDSMETNSSYNHRSSSHYQGGSTL